MSRLPEREAALVRVSAALAARREPQLREALKTSIGVGAPASAVDEVILQAYLFLGYPVALNAFAVWRDVSGERASGPTGGRWDDWRARGEAVCRTVYGGQYENLRANIGGLHEDLAEWMVVEGYGKVLGRPSLDLRMRELCVAALLTVLDAPVQLRSHLRGSLNAGARVAEVEDTLNVALAYADEGAAHRALETWSAVRSRWQTPADSVSR